MVILFPVMNIFGNVYFFGGDIQDVKMFYHNEDHNCTLLSPKHCVSLISFYPLATYIHNFISDVSAADQFDLVTNSNWHHW